TFVPISNIPGAPRYSNKWSRTDPPGHSLPFEALTQVVATAPKQLPSQIDWDFHPFLSTQSQRLHGSEQHGRSRNSR
ncbi:hypothetical protein, partial [Marinobacter sp. EN3]|uniref:hypothetical protein n=1 Tax=Marinobacter sp. EN3 TaxID=1397533 RepID=UPI001D0D137D